MVTLCSSACKMWAQDRLVMRPGDQSQWSGFSPWLGSLAAQPGSGSGSRSKWVWRLKDQMKYCGRRVWGCAWSLPGTRPALRDVPLTMVFGCVVGFWATSQLVGGRALWFPVLASQAHGWLQILASPLSGQVTLGKSLHISRLCVFCKMEVLPFQLLWVAEGFHESLQVPEDLRTRPCLASLSGRAQGSQEFWVNVHKAKCPFSRSAEPL